MESVLIVFIAILVIGAIAFFFTQAGKQTQTRMEELFAEMERHVSDIERLRALPTIPIPGVNLQKDEFGIQQESEAILIGSRTRRVGRGSGVSFPIPVKGLRGVRIYTGRWKSAPVQQAIVVARGTLSLTNKRLIFVGDRRNVTLTWNTLVSVNGDMSTIRVGASNVQQPYVWKVANPAWWALLIQWIAQVRPTNPTLPASAHLKLETGGEGSQRAVQLSGWKDT